MSTKPLSESEIPDLNRTQLHVMEILWNAKEPLKPAGIEAAFEWPIENATLRSVLKLMVERGELQRERVGKAFHYSPAVERRSALRDVARGLARVFSGGSRTGLVAQLLQDESLSEAELRELQAIAGQRLDEQQQQSQKEENA